MHLYQKYIAGLLLLSIPFNVIFACSCVPFEPESNFKKATYVFEAYITSSKLVKSINGKVGPWEGMGGPLVTGEFEVLKSWKGNPKNLSGVITHTENPACGIALSPGSSYLFFIYETATDSGIFSKKNYGVVSRCGNPFSRGYKLLESTRKWLNNK